MIRVQAPDGGLRAVSPEEFRRVFGVEYAPALRVPPTPPDDFLAACARYGAAAQRRADARLLEACRRRLFRPGAGRSPFARSSATYRSRGPGAVPAYVADAGPVGRGLYAARALRPGEPIGEYAGVLSRDWRSQREDPAGHNPYLLKYPFPSAWAIDGRECGNELRFANHSSRGANAARVHVLHRGVVRVLLAATRAIPRRGQILFDYGKGYWRGRSPLELS